MDRFQISWCAVDRGALLLVAGLTGVANMMPASELDRVDAIRGLRHGIDRAVGKSTLA